MTFWTKNTANESVYVYVYVYAHIYIYAYVLMLSFLLSDITVRDKKIYTCYIVLVLDSPSSVSDLVLNTW